MKHHVAKQIAAVSFSWSSRIICLLLCFPAVASAHVTDYTWETDKYVIITLAVISLFLAGNLVRSKKLKDHIEERSAELKALNSQLTTAELEKSLILNSSTEVITFQDLDMRILWANQNAADELKMSTSEMVGKFCYDLRHSGSSTCPGCPVVLARETGLPQKAEMPASTPGRTVLIRAYPVKDQSGELIGIAEFALDISERKQAEEALSKYREKLERLVGERTLSLVKANKELEVSREQLRNLYAHKQSMIEQQRAEIAREVHDELGQSLTGLKMDLAWIKDRLKPDQQLLANKIQNDIKITDDTIQTVKKICSELRPGILDMLGLGAAIEWKASEFQKRTGIICKTKIQAHTMHLDKERRIAIFRIFQESLTNILRHAKATQVVVTLKTGENRAILEVSDNGIGISEENLSNPSSFGLLGMRERVYPWGGEVKISGIPNKGTTVRVSVPV